MITTNCLNKEKLKQTTKCILPEIQQIYFIIYDLNFKVRPPLLTNIKRRQTLTSLEENVIGLFFSENFGSTDIVRTVS